MKIFGGAVVANQRAVSRNGKFHFPRFADLHDLRRQMEQNPAIISGNLENFRRAGEMVRLAQLISLLALSDSQKIDRERLAIYSFNGDGCRYANQDYWRDYVENGRVMGRSALFVATLTSTAPCEAAITLNSHGPVKYQGCELAEILRGVEYLIVNGRISAALLLELEKERGAGVLFGAGEGFVIDSKQKLIEFFE